MVAVSLITKECTGTRRRGLSHGSSGSTSTGTSRRGGLSSVLYGTRSGRCSPMLSSRGLFVVPLLAPLLLLLLEASADDDIAPRDSSRPRRKKNNNSASYKPDSYGNALCSCSLLLSSHSALVLLHRTTMVLSPGHFLLGGARSRY